MKVAILSADEESAVKELNEILDAGFAFQQGVTRSLEDGKVNWTDTFNFSSFITKLPKAIDGAQEVKTLFKNFSESARSAVFAHVSEKFDIPNDEKEALIEETIDELFGDIVVANKWAKYRKAA